VSSRQSRRVGGHLLADPHTLFRSSPRNRKSCPQSPAPPVRCAARDCAFIRDHGKPEPGLAGPGSFNCSVQRKDVGLKAISSMVLMIFEISALDDLIAPIAGFHRLHVARPRCRRLAGLVGKRLGGVPASALRFVMLAISSSEELVPPARQPAGWTVGHPWLALSICIAALAVRSLSPPTQWRSLRSAGDIADDDESEDQRRSTPAVLTIITSHSAWLCSALVRSATRSAAHE